MVTLNSIWQCWNEKEEMEFYCNLRFLICYHITYILICRYRTWLSLLCLVKVEMYRKIRIQGTKISFFDGNILSSWLVSFCLIKVRNEILECIIARCAIFILDGQTNTAQLAHVLHTSQNTLVLSLNRMSLLINSCFILHLFIPCNIYFTVTYFTAVWFMLVFHLLRKF